MRLSYLIVTLTLISGAAVAGETNFGKVVLTRGFQTENTVTRGYTGGSYPLSSVSNRDDRQFPCLGYADNQPDHNLILEDDFEYLKIAVNSNRKDTTILVKGQGKVRCGDDSENRPDASVEDSSWSAGTYQIWVGSIEPNQRWNYRLSITGQ